MQQFVYTQTTGADLIVVIIDASSEVIGSVAHAITIVPELFPLLACNYSRV
jgi:hypothetical protein